MITELRAQNFKPWQDTGMLPFAPLTGFFGANSSGKTSILQVLLMLKQTAEHPSPDWNEPLYFGDENDEKSLVNLGRFDDIIHEHNENLRLGILVSWELHRTMDIKVVSAEISTDSLTFSASVEREHEHTDLTRFCYTTNAQNWVLERKAQGYRFRFPEFLVKTGLLVYSQESIEANPFRCYGVHDSGPGLSSFLLLQRAFGSLFSKIHYLGPLREHPRHHYTWEGDHPKDVGQRGEKMVSALLSARVRRLSVDDQIQKWVKRLELIDSYRLDPVSGREQSYEFHVTEYNGNLQVKLSDVGIGVSQVLPVLALCYYAPEGSILVLEQPEAHLHPKAQSDLADVLIDVVKNRNVQIILESHSEHLLHRLTRRIAEEKLSADDTALYSCQINDGKSEIDQLKVDEYGNISNWPPNFFGDEMGDLAAKARAEIKRKKAIKQ